jgi:hypothetical protein
VRRITTGIAAGAAVLSFMACQGSGSSLNPTGPTCTILQGDQNLNNWSNCLGFLGGSSGGGKNTKGLAPAALYRLIRVNGKKLPYNFGGSEDSVVTVDSTRVINFLLDSSLISLNTDSSAVEIDYISYRDERIAKTHPPGNFNYANYHVADTSVGRWSDSTGQPVIRLITGFVSNIGYQYNGDTLTANYAYNIIDSLGTDVFGVGYFVYQNIGKSYHQIVAARPSAPTASAAVRETRTSSPGLGLVSSHYRRSRLVRVVGQ